MENTTTVIDSDVPKRNIVIDVDGIILDFSKSFTRYHNSISSTVIAENPQSWNYDTDKKYKNTLHKHITNFINAGPTLELFDDHWPELTGKLQNKYNVNIVTAYRHQQSRIDNLRKYNIKYDNIHFTVNTNKVETICKLNPVYIFEDCPIHVQNLSKKLDDTIIYTPNHWNYVKNIPDAHNIVKYEYLKNDTVNII